MYPNYPHFAVAITRTCGSGGGSYIGKKLAKDFDIDLYDRKLLRLAAEDSGINEKIFAAADENTKKTLLYRVSRHVYDGGFIPPESGNFISDQNLFNYQAKVLRELLDEESYVCVGRAADFVLKDKPNVLTVYIDAPYEDRIEREMKRQASAAARPSVTLINSIITAKVTTNTIPAASGGGSKTTTFVWTARPSGWTTAWKLSKRSLS